MVRPGFEMTTMVGRQYSRRVPAQRLEMGEAPLPAAALDCVNVTRFNGASPSRWEDRHYLHLPVSAFEQTKLSGRGQMISNAKIDRLSK
jgi:hypothetical protein